MPPEPENFIQISCDTATCKEKKKYFLPIAKNQVLVFVTTFQTGSINFMNKTCGDEKEKKNKKKIVPGMNKETLSLSLRRFC
jgi:hypothetical protein